MKYLLNLGPWLNQHIWTERIARSDSTPGLTTCRELFFIFNDPPSAIWLLLKIDKTNLHLPLVKYKTLMDFPFRHVRKNETFGEEYLPPGNIFH